MLGDDCVATFRTELEMVLACHFGRPMEKVDLLNVANLSCRIDRWTARSLHFGSSNHPLERPKVLLSANMNRSVKTHLSMDWIELTR